MLAHRMTAALVALALLAPLAGASTELPIGQLVGDLIGGIAGAFPAAPAAPSLPPFPGARLLQPLVDALFALLDAAHGRVLGGLRFLQGEAYKLVLGLSDGDAGSDVGTPDYVSYEVAPLELARERLAVPSLGVEVPALNLSLGTPGVQRNVSIPGVGTPPVEAELPSVQRSLDTPGLERRVVVDTPAVDVPRVAARTPPVDVEVPRVEIGPQSVRVPPLAVDVPRIEAPALNVSTPPVDVRDVNQSADVSGVSVGVQRVRGTLYLGPQNVSYDLGPYEVGVSQLPPEVPRRVDVVVPPQQVPPQTLLQRDAQVLVEGQRVVLSNGTEVPITREPIALGGQRVSLNSTEVVLTEGFQALPAMRPLNQTVQVPPQHVAELAAGGGRVAVPGVGLTPPVTVPLNVPARRVADVTTPGAGASTGEIVLHDGPVGVPGLSGVMDPLGDLDGLGYFGYGRDGDSSLYPYACTPVAGCVSSRGYLGFAVEAADCALDEAAARLDQPVRVALPPPPPGPPNFPGFPYLPCVVLVAPQLPPPPPGPGLPGLPLLPPFG